tara:strand:- start:4784 stop:5938 length:1155 start_codon:yes stop_codon:yes gene_type:complete
MLPQNIGSELSISSIFLDHDIEYFTHDSIRKKYKDVNGTFYSTCEVGDSLVTNVFDIVEKENPDTIITIGAFSDLEYIRAIKRVIPHDFNWVVILTSNVTRQISGFLDTLSEADSIVCLTNQTHQVLNNNNIDNILVKYGPEDAYFHSKYHTEDYDSSGVCPIFMVNDKNVQQSNLAVVLDAFSNFVDCDFKLILHTNYYESGDYDLDYLISKFKVGQIEIPDDFIGLKEGCSTDELIQKYAKAHFFIDASIKPITSLCSIEAASQGCIPIICSSGALNESIIEGSSILKLSDFTMQGNLFFGEHLESFYIISQDILCNMIRSSIELFNENLENYLHTSQAVKVLSEGFSEKGFCEKVSNFIIRNDYFVKKKGIKTKTRNYLRK